MIAVAVVKKARESESESDELRKGHDCAKTHEE
jgi:hypothetical protein